MRPCVRACARARARVCVCERERERACVCCCCCYCCCFVCLFFNCGIKISVYFNLFCVLFDGRMVFQCGLTVGIFFFKVNTKNTIIRNF